MGSTGTGKTGGDLMKARSNTYRNYVVNLLRRTKYITVLDTETSGISKDAQIIQFSAIHYQVGFENGFYMKKTDAINMFIRPEAPLSPKVTELTGLTDDFLRPYDKEELAAFGIFDYLKRTYGPIVGYNIRFDMTKIKGLFLRRGLEFEEKECIDVLEMARDCISKEDIKDYKLESVADYLKTGYGITYHNALDDATVTARCFIRLLQIYLQSIRKEKETARESPTVSYCYYWVNPHKNSMRRIIAVTSSMQVYYDLIKKQWGVNKDSPVCIGNLNIDDIERQCLQRYRCSSMSDLAFYLKNLRKKK